MKNTKNKKSLNKPKIKNNKILTIVAVFIVSIIGGVILSSSQAATTFTPIQAGLNFQAGWSNGQHTEADNQKIIDEAATAGIKWVRIDIGWGTIEETGDTFGGASDPTATYPSTASNHWYIKKIDHAVNYAKSKGINVMGVWWVTPPWNTDGGTGKPYTTRPAGYPTYPEYAESAEWAAKYWAGRIDNWEVWNEADPDQSFWLKPDGSRHTINETTYYAELLKSAYPAFKRGNPNSKVMVSGASSVDVEWYSKLYDNGIKNYFDIMAVHPYESPANTDPLSTNGTQDWQFMHIPALRQLMVDRGDANKPMWFTEVGYSTHDNTDLTGDGKVESWQLGVTEQQQGDYLVKSIDYAKKNWPYVEVFIMYNDKNRSSAGGDAETARHQMNFGLLYADNTPKPAMNILKQYLTTPTIDPQPTPVKQSLSVPINVTSSASENTVTIYWDQVPYADSYEVKWGKNNEWTFTSKDNYPFLSNTSFTIGNLEPNNLYNFSVAALDSTGNYINSEFSSPVYDKLLVPIISPISYPSNLTVTSGKRQLKTQWSSTSDSRVDGYVVRYIKSNSTDKTNANSWTYMPFTTNLNLTINKLSSGVRYDIQVSSVDNKGTVAITDDIYSDYSNTVMGIPR